MVGAVCGPQIPRKMASLMELSVPPLGSTAWNRCSKCSADLTLKDSCHQHPPRGDLS